MYLNLKFSILQLGLRQNRVAQAIRVDEALLSKIINGFREPTSAQGKFGRVVGSAGSSRIQRFN